MHYAVCEQPYVWMFTLLFKCRTNECFCNVHIYIIYIYPHSGQNSHLSLLTGDGNAAIFVVLNRRASLLDQCAVAGGREEGWNPGTPGPDPLCQSSLKKRVRLKDDKYINVTCMPLLSSGV